MSLMKRYQEDTEELTRRATEAAWESTGERRKAALDTVFQDCGTAARIYADPRRVTQYLVIAVGRAFMGARKATVYRVAG